MAAKLIEEEQAETRRTKTKTIQHEYGKEEIEVAECDSCGQEAKEEKMREFRIYDNEFGRVARSGNIVPRIVVRLWMMTANRRPVDEIN